MSPRTNTPLKRRYGLIAVLLGVMISACGAPELPSPFHAVEVGGKFEGADFRLTGHDGKSYTLADFRGKAVVLFFGYLYCPDVCPTTMADLSRVMRLLGKDAQRVQVLFVTVDPARDSPELLRQFATAFDPSFLALYGDAQATEEAAHAFGVVYRKRRSGSTYSVDHSAGSYLIEPAGKVRLLAPYGLRPEWLVGDLRLLLAPGAE